MRTADQPTFQGAGPLSRDPERLYLTYRISSGDVDATVEALRVEQTIEFPAEYAPAWIRDTLVGQVEHRSGDEVTLSYDARILDGADGLTQFLNVIWGNASLLQDLRVVDIEPPRSLLEVLPGPRFGVDGVRNLTGVRGRPLLATALKPMGMSAAEMAAEAALLTEAGIDLIKDDHGLSDQPWAPWRERVQRVAAAVAETNASTGRSTVYLPSLNVPFDQFLDRAHEAKELGAGGVLVLPGVSSFDAVRALATDPDFGLPIMSHPAMLGSFHVPRGHGIDAGLIYGLIMRLAGSDFCVYVNHGGRFGQTREECEDIRDRCRRPLGPIRPALPTPGGGMSVARVPDLVETYGADAAFLVGGALRAGDLRTNAQELRAAVETATGR